MRRLIRIDEAGSPGTTNAARPTATATAPAATAWIHRPCETTRRRAAEGSVTLSTHTLALTLALALALTLALTPAHTLAHTAT